MKFERRGSLSSSSSSMFSTSTASSTEDFWQQFTGGSGCNAGQQLNISCSSTNSRQSLNCSNNGAGQTVVGCCKAGQQQLKPTNTFVSLLRKILKVGGAKSQCATTKSTRTAVRRPVSRDMLDDALADFDVTTQRSRFRQDFQYIQEYTLNFNTCRNSEKFRKVFETTKEEEEEYDDVFSDYSDPHEDSDVEDYSEVHDGLDARVYDAVEDDSGLQGPCTTPPDYADVYYVNTAVWSELPPPLPRRMSDSRAPARPPVPAGRRA